MLRRMIVLALAGIAVSAPPALASLHWNSQMKHGSATASRKAGGCTFAAGSQVGSLLVTCGTHEYAKLTYVFSSSKTVQGKATRAVSRTGRAGVQSTVSVKGTLLTVTVTVSGAGSAQVNTVSVGYYTG
jgi:hypothetical protein